MADTKRALYVVSFQAQVCTATAENKIACMQRMPSRKDIRCKVKALNEGHFPFSSSNPTVLAQAQATEQAFGELPLT
jgi:hypothetical protein